MLCITLHQFKKNNMEPNKSWFVDVFFPFLKGPVQVPYQISGVYLTCHTVDEGNPAPSEGPTL